MGKTIAYGERVVFVSDCCKKAVYTKPSVKSTYLERGKVKYEYGPDKTLCSGCHKVCDIHRKRVKMVHYKSDEDLELYNKLKGPLGGEYA